LAARLAAARQPAAVQLLRAQVAGLRSRVVAMVAARLSWAVPLLRVRVAAQPPLAPRPAGVRSRSTTLPARSALALALRL
jgi:hypothetical protein